MKLLYQSSDRQDIEASRLLLESRGIPVHVSNEDTNRNLSYMSIAVQLGIWVIFDEQYNDAITLLGDDTHEVENPIDIDEFHSMLDKKHKERTKSNFDRSMLVLVLLITIGVGAYFIFKISNA